MVHPYLRRRTGEEEVTYPNEAIREVLHKTLGVPIFQEQAMRLAVVAAGFTPGEADQLRRAMAAWRRPGVIDQFREKLLDGMQANGLPEEFAERVYQQIRGFGEYGFPESHAASFALLVYVSAWLKHYYPAAFAAALINSQPMGFYAPAQLVRDAREHGVEVRPVDVNRSGWDCTLEQGAGSREQGVERSRTRRRRRPRPPVLRLGLRMINGLREVFGRAIERARDAGPFTSIDDFARRTGLGQAVIKRLAEADAFGSLGANRRQAVWQSLAQEKKPKPLPLFDRIGPSTIRKQAAAGELLCRAMALGRRSRRRLPLGGSVAAGASDFVLSPASSTRWASRRRRGWRSWRTRRRSAWRGWCCCGSGRARRRGSRSSRSKTKPAR